MDKEKMTRPESDEEKKTTLTLSLTESDKKKLKVMAEQQETPIAAIIHEWVKEHTEDERN